MSNPQDLILRTAGERTAPTVFWACMPQYTQPCPNPTSAALEGFKHPGGQVSVKTFYFLIRTRPASASSANEALPAPELQAIMHILPETLYPLPQGSHRSPVLAGYRRAASLHTVPSSPASVHMSPLREDEDPGPWNGSRCPT